MGTLIVHAIQNEEKSAKGGRAGDQLQVVPSGQPDYKGEIRRADWYKRSDASQETYGSGWDQYLECTDDRYCDKAVEMAIKIADDRRFGYDQSARWGGYKQIRDKGFDRAENGDFDCSSLAISVYIFAGVPNLEPVGYTGNIDKYLLKTGYFKEYKDREHLASCDYAKRGGLYVKKGKHVIIMAENGKYYKEDKPVPTPTPTPTPDPEPEPIESGEYVYVLGSVNVREAPDGTSKILSVAHKGDLLPYLGDSSFDRNGNEWYHVDDTKGHEGYISAFTNKSKKYTKLVTLD